MKKLNIIGLILALLVGSQIDAVGQLAPPVSNIYLLKFQRQGENYYKFQYPTLLTYATKTLYNNQPSFIGEILYYASLQTDNQTDILSFNIKTAKTDKITSTPNLSEYSPTIYPENPKLLTIVKMEEDGKTQRLWNISREEGKDNKTEAALIEKFKNVGYYRWITNQRIALFLIEKPNKLVLYDTKTQTCDTIASNVGRCLQVSPRGEISYVSDIRDEQIYIKVWSPITKKSSRLIEILPFSEDFLWLPNGAIWMGSGSRIYEFIPGKQRDWVEIADLSPYGITNITRLAFKDNSSIAIVNVEK
jgi:hypothetical protein